MSDSVFNLFDETHLRHAPPRADRPLRTWAGPHVELRRHGIYIPEADLWLDPARRKPAAFVSHAHADHARGSHDWALATAPTHAFMRARGLRCGGDPVPFDMPIHRNGCTLTLRSAGHMLGSAQIVVDTPTGRLVYTGDCKLGPSRTAGPPAEPIRCDLLIIEATFGLPIYRFDPRPMLEARIVHEAHAALAAGEVPVFLGYTLGKGPEIARILADAHLPVRVWGGMVPMLRIYHEHGVRFDDVLTTTAGAPLRDVCWVVPPGAMQHPGMAAGRQRVIYCSGWGLLDSSSRGIGADASIPLSDHFDWPELLRYVEVAQPRRVLVTHGYCEPVARHLRSLGVDADPLDLQRVEEEAD